MRTLLAIIFYTYSSLASSLTLLPVDIGILLERNFKIVAAHNKRLILQKGKDAYSCGYSREGSSCFELK